MNRMDEDEIVNKYKKSRKDEDSYDVYFKKELDSGEPRLLKVSQPKKQKNLKLFKVETRTPKEKTQFIKLPIDRVMVKQKMYTTTITENRVVNTEVQTSTILEKERTVQTVGTITCQPSSHQVEVSTQENHIVQTKVLESKTRKEEAGVETQYMIFSRIQTETFQERIDDLRASTTKASTGRRFDTNSVPQFREPSVEFEQQKPRLKLATRMNVTASYEKYMESFGIEVIPK